MKFSDMSSIRKVGICSGLQRDLLESIAEHSESFVIPISIQVTVDHVTSSCIPRNVVLFFIISSLRHLREEIGNKNAYL